MDSMRHFFTGEDSDRQVKIVNKTLTTTRTTPSDPRLLSCCRQPSYPKKKLLTQIRRPIRRPRILPISTSTLKKRTEIADQLTLTRAEYEGIDSDSSSLLVIEGFRPGQYIPIQPTNVPCEKIEKIDPIIVGGQVSYLLKNVSDLSPQVPRKGRT